MASFLLARLYFLHSLLNGLYLNYAKHFRNQNFKCSKVWTEKKRRVLNILCCYFLSLFILVWKKWFNWRYFKDQVPERQLNPATEFSCIFIWECYSNTYWNYNKIKLWPTPLTSFPLFSYQSIVLPRYYS